MTDVAEQSVEIVEWNPTWPARFEEESRLLQAAIGAWLIGGIQHVGSTAIPGTAAKPVIDIMVGVESLAASQPAIPVLAGLGYQYFPYRRDVMHWLCKPSPQLRTHHLHLVPARSELWVARIAFRDYLIARPEVAAEYVALKRELAAKHRCDREAYTAAKTEFVEAVLEQVRRAADE